MPDISQFDPVIIRTLGNMAIYQSGQLVTDFISRKSELVFIYLTADQRSQKRESIANLFWDSGTKTSVLNNLSKALTNIRQLFPGCVVSTRNTVSIELENWVDFVILEEHYHRLIKTHGDYGELSRHDVHTIVEFLQEYSGEFLPGVDLQNASDFEEWLLYKRTTIRHQQLSVMHELGQYYLYSGQYEKGLVWAQRQLELDPYWEDALQQLVYLLAGLNRYPDARRRYEVFAHRLDEELGVNPNADLQRLYLQVREKRVELPEIQHIHNNLPEFHSNTVQRPQAQRQIAEWMGDNSNRLLSLVGLGGSGKSRLAIYTAKQHLLDFPDGVYFVTFEEDESLEECAQRIARAIGIFLQENIPSMSQLHEVLRDHQILLILDSIEVLTCRKYLVTSLLQNTDPMHLLVTTRFPLGIDDEHILPIKGFTYPKTSEAPTETSEALQFFIQAARNVQPDFSLDTNRETVVRICSIVGGLPLVLELVAQWLPILSLEQIAQYLENQPTVLTEDPSALGEQLKRVFEYSFYNLSETEQESFMLLATHINGFIAEIILESGHISANQIHNFSNMSLIYASSPTRYQMHPLIRHMVLEKATSLNLSQELYMKHATLYAQFAEKCLRRFYTPDEFAAYHDGWQEYDNFIQALKFANEYDHLDLVIPILAVMSRIVRQKRIALVEVVSYADLLENYTGKQYAYQEALANMGSLLSDTQYLDRSAAFAERALQLSLQNSSPRQIALRSLDAASVSYRQNQREQTLKYLNACLEISEEIKDNYLEGMAKGHMSSVYAISRQFDVAQRLMTEALELSLTSKNTNLQIQMLAYLGTLNTQLENYELALDYSQKALDLIHKHGMYFYYMQVLDIQQRAFSLLDEPDMEAAYESCYKLIEYARRSGAQRQLSQALYRMASLKFQDKEYSPALIYYQQTLPMLISNQNKLLAAYAATEMCATLIYLEEFKAAAILMGYCKRFIKAFDHPLWKDEDNIWTKSERAIRKVFDKNILNQYLTQGTLLSDKDIFTWLPQLRENSRTIG